jgi:hypothetical protein
MVTRVALTDQSIATGAVDETADQIHELVAAGFTLQETGGTLTATGAEQTLYINNNPLGCFNPLVLFVDLDNMVAGDTTVVAGDTTVFRVYYRIAAGGALRLFDYQSYTGIDGGLANGRHLIAIELLPNRFGLRVTLQQTAGTNRAYVWSYFEES